MKILGICLIVVAIVATIGVYAYIWKKNAGQEAFWDKIVNSLDFLLLVGLVVFAGVLFICS